MTRKPPLQVAREEGSRRRRALERIGDDLDGLGAESRAVIEALIEEAALGAALFRAMDERGLRLVLEVHRREVRDAGETAPAWLRESVLALDAYATAAPCIRDRGGWDRRQEVRDG